MKIVRTAYIVFFIYTILAYFSARITWLSADLGGIMAMTVLPCLVLNFAFIVYFIVRKKKYWIIASLILYIIGYKHINRTFTISLPVSKKPDLIVLNSNVRIFNVYKHLRNSDNSSSINMIKWLQENEADILILQEYYNNDNDITFKIWDVTKRLKKNYPYHTFRKSLVVSDKSEFGQVIFSKYPIINTREIYYDNKTFNFTFFVDVKVKSDTVRIYNTHLESLKIEERVIFAENKDNSEIKNKFADTIKKLQRGFKFRVKQVDKIISEMEKSPYPVILGGDFNDLPYGYAYNSFSKIMNNAFEEKGNGFGFSFNGKLFFLRIDNLFSGKELEVNYFKVHRNIPYSDHFPISAGYNFKK